MTSRSKTGACASSYSARNMDSMTTTKPLTLTVTVTATGETIVTEHDKMPAVHRYLERFAASRGWFWSKHKVATNQWAGRLTPEGPSDDQMASFTLTK